MLIVALILAVIGLAALVTAVVTSNEVVAWVCIGASGLGVLILIVDAIRDRARRRSELPAAAAGLTEDTTEVIQPTAAVETLDDETAYDAESFVEESVEESEYVAEESEDVAEDIAEDISEDIAEEDHPEELVYDDPDYDTPSDDEADFPVPAEEAAVHTVSESYLAQDVTDEDVTDEDVTEESATELRYVDSPEESAPTVTYTYSESAETEYVDTGDSPVEEERRDQ